MSKFIKIQTLSKSIVFTIAALFALSAQADGHGDHAKKDVAAPVVVTPMDIVDTAVKAGSFNTLATALTEAGLIETLKGEGPFTVFAPTDEAFAKIPADKLKTILADKELLSSILTYHVVAGKVMAADVVNLQAAPTVQGSDLAVSVADGVKVNDANVIQTDIEASNGVIHVIDTVLVPAAE